MFFRKKKVETRVIIKIQTKIEVSPPGQIQADEAPPPYHAEPEATDCTNTTRNTECEVRLRSGDVSLADIIAEKSVGPTAAIAKAIYTAAYAVPRDLVAETVTNVSGCIQVTIETIADLPQEDRDKAASAMAISITNAVRMVTAVGPRHIIGGMTSEEATAAVRVATAFDRLSPTARETAEDCIRGIISCSVAIMFSVPKAHIESVATTYTNAISGPIEAIVESPAEVQHDLAMSFISFAEEIADYNNDGKSFTLPGSV